VNDIVLFPHQVLTIVRESASLTFSPRADDRRLAGAYALTLDRESRRSPPAPDVYDGS
jgi:hypothetical protein